MILRSEQLTCTGRAPTILHPDDWADCSNPSCDRKFKPQGRGKFCCKDCREFMRNDDGYRAIPQLMIPMSTWWKLEEQAEIRGFESAEQLIADLIDDAAGVE